MPHPSVTPPPWSPQPHPHSPAGPWQERAQHLLILITIDTVITLVVQTLQEPVNRKTRLQAVAGDSTFDSSG